MVHGMPIAEAPRPQKFESFTVKIAKKHGHRTVVVCGDMRHLLEIE